MKQATTKETLGTLVQFARGHRGVWLRGLSAALGVVGLRLALPWPVEAFVRPLMSEELSASQLTLSAQLLPGLLFLAIAAGLGLADHLERLWFARFSIGLVRDLRSEAFAGLMRSAAGSGQGRPGDLVARLVGDSARLKAGVKGFLVHVATNGVVFLGVSIVFLVLYWPIGLAFVVSGLILSAGTALAASRVHERASRYRKKEGQLAEAIHGSLGAVLPRTSFARVNRSSGDHEAALTRHQGLATWMAHVLFGATVLASFAIGWRGLASGETTARTLVILAMYALIIRVPMVQLARQGTRTGKILASGRRLASLLDRDESEVASHGRSRRLESSIAMRDLVLKAGRRRGGRRRLGPLNLELEVGEAVLVLGPPSSGKSSLLEVLAGVAEARRGEVLWDGVARSAHQLREQLGRSIGFQPDEPSWPACKLSKLLEVGDVSTERIQEVARACSLGGLLKRLPQGLDTRVASTDLSSAERRAVAVARAVLRGDSIQLLDQPVSGLPKRSAKRQLRRLLATTPGALRVIAMESPLALGQFDRVLELKRGRVIFDGSPEAWRAVNQQQTPSVQVIAGGAGMGSSG